MDLEYGERYERFRREVRAFLDEHAASRPKTPYFETPRAELEPARSLMWYAAHSFDALPEEAPLLVCHVLAHISEIAREIASVSTQVHGGIGWTDEQNLHFWYKRIGVARHLLGGPEFLRERAASLQSLDLAS